MDKSVFSELLYDAVLLWVSAVSIVLAKFKVNYLPLEYLKPDIIDTMRNLNAFKRLFFSIKKLYYVLKIKQEVFQYM